MSTPEMFSAESLRAYIDQLTDWQLVEIGTPYEHMGALICDAGLQAGINYKSVVWPRIESLMSKHPGAATTSGFLSIAMVHGTGHLLSWSGEKKLRTIASLAMLFHRHGVETVHDLRVWLGKPGSLETLVSVSGVGPKSVDYIQLLAGLSAVAVDVHLYKFVAQSGIGATTYHDVRDLIARTATLMGIESSILDHSIWSFMSNKKAGS